MEKAFFTQLNKQGIKLSIEDKFKYFLDFKKYCEEMEFATEEEVSEGIKEYITCQVHYGTFR
ncbi:hypothetical protein [Niallia sp. 03133]|uniref:hypothetical protein n=1 Tax=Niallia sp. 03133 TaxID=3458060 RepID=UPI004044EA21